MTEQPCLHWVVNLQLSLFRIRVSSSKEPFHQLGFLNLINTVSGNCLMSDLEQHAFLFPFYFWNHFAQTWTLRFILSRLDCISSLLLLVSKGFRPQWPVICPLTRFHADSLMSWHRRPRLPVSGLRVAIAFEEGMQSSTTVGYYKCEGQPICCHRRTWWPFCEAALSHQPVTVLSRLL